jgi:prepilin-type N-terminal cleavage/methylation domain-containing protein
MKLHLNFYKAKKGGFTLIELLVSVAIFMVVVTIAMGAYVSLISLDRKARATGDLVSNLSFVTNSMSRSMRTGFDYRCGGGGDCASGGSSFTFTDENCRAVTYIRNTTANSVGMCVSLPDPVGCNPTPVVCSPLTAPSITDPRVRVTNLTFFTRGVSSPTMQPTVSFTLTGVITPDPRSGDVSFTIQGGATQRIIDL